MRNPFLSILFIVLAHLPFSSSLQAQVRIPLNPGVYDSWKNIDNTIISDDGNVILFEINPQYGDGVLIVRNSKNQSVDTLPRGYDAALPANASFVGYKIKPPLETLRKAKLDGKKKDELPKDSLGIFLFNGQKMAFPFLESFKVPAEQGNSILALFKTEPLKADSTRSDSASKAQKPEKTNKNKSKDEAKTYTLRLFLPDQDTTLEREKVSLAELADLGTSMVYATLADDSLKTSTIWLYDIKKNAEKIIFSQPGTIKNLKLHRSGDRFGFHFSNDTIKEKRYSLYLYNNGSCTMICDTADLQITSGYSPSENGKLHFSHDGSKLYFGIAETPRAQPKDTLTDDEKATVDVWNYLDPKLQPQQLKELEADKKKTFLSVYHLKEKKITVLEDEKVTSINTGFRGDGIFALGYAAEPYLLQASWTGRRLRDIYLVNNMTGGKEMLLSAHEGPVSLSNEGKHLAWYSLSDSLWHTMSLKTRKPLAHKVEGIAFYDEMHDVPGLPGAEGYAGWTKDDKLFVVYDKYDLWGLNPEGTQRPVNLTTGLGRTQAKKFRNLKLDADVPYIGIDNGEFLLASFDEKTKKAGYYLGSGNDEPMPLIEEDGKFNTPIKSKDAQMVVWTKSDFRHFPDLWLSDMRFKNPVKISTANPQQKNYLWGSVEPYQWLSTEGDSLNGLLYKPENFDPTKKYPMLVYFYEKYSDQLHQHYVPKPSRSIISPTYCISNEYVVFIPDINYSNGYPGQSAYHAVVSGTLALISEGFIDKEKIGIQGQSWGGYQVAWLVTRTNLFKAAMAGAPVSNMTSAYGGIRWESGVVRQFQYEAGQSRIGANLWERPDLYIENSPLFRVDKVETPLLIMANDGDGAVPWYQGIELFTALRRLQKPVWMLNYNGDEHNLKQRANMQDLDRRMMQFFDHFLKGEPAPEWMKVGVPALRKGEI
jgi:dipeptidyl aminopeptidase/acylaminoacyl peptidase